MTNPADNSLGSCLYADRGALNDERRRWYDGHIVDWVVQVAAVSGNVITLARPLRLEVRPGWTPEIWQHRPAVEEVGIEDLTIQFPNTPYRGHWKEEGYYAIQLLGAFNCWVRRVTIVDADIGVVIMAGGHNTVSGVTLRDHWRTGGETGETGHYGFGVRGHAQDNLIEDCSLEATFVHNLSVNAFASGNVYSRITTRGSSVGQAKRRSRRIFTRPKERAAWANRRLRRDRCRGLPGHYGRAYVAGRINASGSPAAAEPFLYRDVAFTEGTRQHACG